ncbi:MAG: signal peptidase I [Solirubrobacterales bacterium]
MDKFRDYISLILKGLNISKKRRLELEEELFSHLNMRKKQFLEEGYSHEESEIKAIESFGNAGDINMEFKKICTTYSRLKDLLKLPGVFNESLKWAATMAGALIISLSFRSYVFASAEVRQCSMQDTLFEGQRVVENKIGYYYSKPQRGDIVIINRKLENGSENKLVAEAKEIIQGFYKADSDRLIKRVIGIPGDTIAIKEGSVYINGKLYEEAYVKGYTYPNSMIFPITIPEGYYFVLGDNRENSMDSRDIGLIPNYEIEGRAVLRIWPLNKAGNIDK